MISYGHAVGLFCNLGIFQCAGQQLVDVHVKHFRVSLALIMMLYQMFTYYYNTKDCPRIIRDEKNTYFGLYMPLVLKNKLNIIITCNLF